MRDMDKRKAEIAVPLVALHGTADHTTSLVAVKTLLKECVSPDATLKEYPGASLLQQSGLCSVTRAQAWRLARYRLHTCVGNGH